MRHTLPFIFLFFLFYSCNSPRKDNIQRNDSRIIENNQEDTAIIDSKYNFDEAIKGTKAPENVIQQLELVDVCYYSTDAKLHKGQILTNKVIAKDIQEIFNYMLKLKFQIAHVIPVVKYDWNDNLSMEDNNTYSFCFRDTTYSKHATGMAIDINPLFNPLHWKTGFEYRAIKPAGARVDTTVNGTFYPSHPVVQEFKKRGFFWGHYFKSKYDDHHFQKR